MNPKKKTKTKKDPFEGKSLRQILNVDVKVDTPEVNHHERGRLIPIASLPDCPHKERLINLVMRPDEAHITVVAFRNLHDGLWTCYAGYPDIRDVKPLIFTVTDNFEWLCENVRDRSQVLIMGDKLAPDVAIKIFDGMKLEQFK